VDTAVLRGCAAGTFTARDATMSLLTGEWKHLRRTPPGGRPADAPASPANHLHLRRLPGKGEEKTFASGAGPPRFFDPAPPPWVLAAPIETPLPLPAPERHAPEWHAPERNARGRSSMDAVAALTSLKRSLVSDFTQTEQGARTSRKPREDTTASHLPSMSEPVTTEPGAPKSLPKLPMSIEVMSYRQLKDFYPLVFGGKTTNSNNKGWLYRVIKARYEEGDEVEKPKEEETDAGTRPRRGKRVNTAPVVSAGAA
tara:strand:- start:1943 stop:2707 length:765 start_codon:yes stop_codon:yes gene_type:complete